MITRKEALRHAPALGLLVCSLAPWAVAVIWTTAQSILDQIGMKPQA